MGPQYVLITMEIENVAIIRYVQWIKQMLLHVNYSLRTIGNVGEINCERN